MVLLPLRTKRPRRTTFRLLKSNKTKEADPENQNPSPQVDGAEDVELEARARIQLGLTRSHTGEGDYSKEGFMGIAH